MAEKLATIDGVSAYVERNDRGEITRRFYMENGQFTSSDNWPGKWRSSVILDDNFTRYERKGRSEKTEVKIEVFTVTPDKHDMATTRRNYRKAVQQFIKDLSEHKGTSQKFEKNSWGINFYDTNEEHPKPIHQSEDSIGQWGFYSIDGAQFEVDL